MHKAAIIAIVAGFIVGVVGGLVAGQLWLGVGATIAFVGITGLWCLGIWKKPRETFLAEAGVKAMASGYPSHLLESPPQAQPVSGETAAERPSPSLPGAGAVKDERCQFLAGRSRPWAVTELSVMRPNLALEPTPIDVAVAQLAQCRRGST